MFEIVEGRWRTRREDKEWEATKIERLGKGAGGGVEVESTKKLAGVGRGGEGGGSRREREREMSAPIGDVREVFVPSFYLPKKLYFF